ncbi:MAG: type I DNA topoisomerase [Erysipelotrichaceae bacterium]
MKKLVIVESPSKSKTIEKYLGKDYTVVSSKGHIRDLATTGVGRLGIDIENGFVPTYKISKEKKDVVKELKALAKKCDEVYLASDPDREGEAIAWHLAEELGVDQSLQNRVIFNEITPTAVLAAFEHPRSIDQDLVRSQETRRMLDRIIGFKLSKLLQSKIRSKSAGRVQSVALRLICEKEAEIRAFVSEEYWELEAMMHKGELEFPAKLGKVDGKKPPMDTEADANEVMQRCNGVSRVASIERKKKKKEAKLPFITSSLQQESSTKLNYSAKKTMSIAQKLYEGISVNGQTQGLITYMRSDSYRLSDGFVQDALAFIGETYGEAYVGKARQKKNENAQDAHEAIRPTNLAFTPESIKDSLTSEQYRVYKLIYARTLASLMASSVSDAVNVKVENNGVEFSANGSTLVFDGYLAIYGDYETTKDTLLPQLEVDEILDPVQLNATQNFTQPPARYTEAKLIKMMEEKGIGRPSTYATIIDTVQARGYVTLDKASETGKTKFFYPTEQGELTNEKLVEFFSDVVNVSYTAQMESELDEIAEGARNNVEALTSFYEKFEPLIQFANDNMEKKELERTGEACPDCGKELVYRVGRYGKFVSCIDFPNCKYTKGEEEEEPIEEPCPQCGGKLVHKKGRYGKFVACSNYPECKYIKSDKVKAEPVPTGEACPQCGHDLVTRKSRFGKDFIACSNYPKCRYIKSDKKKDEEGVDASDKPKKTTKKATAKKTTKKTTTKKTATKKTAAKKTVKKTSEDEA